MALKMSTDNLEASKAELSQLPDEILLHILSYLTPNDQITLSLVCQRFKRIACDQAVVGKVDLSRLSFEDARNWNKYFGNRELAQNIRELNFSFCFSNGRKIDLENYICRCRNVVGLHVVHCNITLPNLCNILQKLPNLRTLSWSYGDAEPPSFDPLKKVKPQLKSLTNLYLEVQCQIWSVEFLRYFLHCCLQLEECHVNIWGTTFSSTLAVVAHQRRFRDAQDITLPNLHSFIATYEPCAGDSGDYVTLVVHGILASIVCAILSCHSPDVNWQKFWIPSELCPLLRDPFNRLWPLQNLNSLKVLAGKYESRDGLESNFLKKVTCTTLEHIGLDDMTIVAQDLNVIMQCGGLHLKTLNLHSCFWTPRALTDQLPFISFFLTCKNITELNLIKCHFNAGDNMCTALGELQSLSIIALHECVILSKSHETKVEGKADDSFYGLKKRRRIARQGPLANSVSLEPVSPSTSEEPSSSNSTCTELTSPFISMVNKCEKVTEFHLHGCMHNVHKSCTDDDLDPICQWKKLEVLSLESVSYSGHGKFIEHITTHCKHLSTLKFSSPDVTGYPTSFLLSLYSAIKQAAALKHLRIHHPLINLNSVMVWHALSGANKLHRLCLQTKFTESLSVEVVCQFLGSLPYLSVLHIHSPVANEKSALTKLKAKLQAMQYDGKMKVIIEQLDTSLPLYHDSFKGEKHQLELKELCQTSAFVAVPKYKY